MMGDPSFFGWFVPIIPIAGTAVLVLFVIGLVMEGKSGAGRGKGLRNAFMYSVAVLSLGTAISSGVYLMNLGLRTTVLPKADTQRLWDSPPSLYLEPKNQTTFMPETLNCKESCELSDADKANFGVWKEQYAKWQVSHGSGSARTQRDAVNGFSFLIVALGLFIVFFRMIQREHRGSDAPGPMRSFYYYGFALVGLVMIVVTGIMLINLGLKTWVFPKAAEDYAPYGMPPVSVVTVSGPELAPYQSIKNCSEKCGLTADDVALVDQWIKDTNDVRKNTYPQGTNRQRDLATELPIFAAGLPLFLYHFMSIRRQTKNGVPPTPPSPATA